MKTLNELVARAVREKRDVVAATGIVMEELLEDKALLRELTEPLVRQAVMVRIMAYRHTLRQDTRDPRQERGQAGASMAMGGLLTSWLVGDQPLGRCRRADIEAELAMDQAKRDGYQRNVMFYEGILGRLTNAKMMVATVWDEGALCDLWSRAKSSTVGQVA